MIKHRGSQLRAIGALVPMRRGIVKAPAGSGKTIIGADAASRWAAPRARLARRKQRIAIVANTTEQCDQWRKACGIFESLEQSAEITIVCYASGLALAGFDLVIFDECHHVAAREARKMLDGHMGWRWGVSATPMRADEDASMVFELIGPVICEISREEVMAEGGITEGQVVIHQPNAPKEMERAIMQVAMPAYEAMCRKMRYLGNRFDAAEAKKRCVMQAAKDIGLFHNPKRDAVGVRLALEHAADSVIVLIGKIEHGEELAMKAPGSIVVHSKMGAKKRREALAAFGSGELRTIFATSLADEGLDVPRANILINLAAGRSERLAEQRSGRVLRAFAGKTHGVIHDFMDVQHYYLHAQSRARIAKYRELGYGITFAGEGQLV